MLIFIIDRTAAIPNKMVANFRNLNRRQMPGPNFLKDSKEQVREKGASKLIDRYFRDPERRFGQGGQGLQRYQICDRELGPNQKWW